MSEGKSHAMQYICQHAFTLQFVLYGGTVALLLNVVALLELDPNSAGYTVALINLPGLLFFMVLAAYTIRKCAAE